MTNREFAEKDKDFRDACAAAKIPPSVRQASKYRLGFGKAWEARKHVILDSAEKLRIAS